MSLNAIDAASRTPVTLLTGFLGSGKTTVLNHILKRPEMAATAVIVNEFGEIGIDHLLVEKATDDVVLMQSGCLCCTIRSDIADTLVNLFVDRAKGRIPAFERVVIETTGLADPAPILHALMQDPIVAERYMVDGVVTTVDAVNGAGTLDMQVEAVKQAAVADRLLLTKCDAASAAARRDLEARLAVLNPGAPVIEVTGGAVDPSFLFNLGLYDPTTKTVEVQRWLGEEAFADGHDEREGHDEGRGHDHHAHHDVNRHDAHISSFCITREKPMSWTALSGWLDALT
ncbi:MAG: GTP-binding protein, partial [Stellaceae bacterium]